MKRYLYIYIIAAISIIATSCSAYTHKELCENHREHAHRYHVEVVADYRCDWEENFISGNPDNPTTWELDWPSNYMDYESLRPGIPSGLRVINYGESGNYNVHNISAKGGIVDLYEGSNDILFYNNDTEYIVFSRNDNGVTTRATTRTRTRASYTPNIYGGDPKEPTVNAPDMLYANYFEDYFAEKVLEPTKLPVTMQPLVFTYKIRYEFAEGLKYVAVAKGALTGMAESVLLNTGETSEKAATILFDDCEITDYGVRAIVRSFGAPGYPNLNYPTRNEEKHGLSLEVMLRNGNIINFDFDVTKQVMAQPHGGVIVVKDIKIEESEGMQGTGSFDVEVDDWGEYEDIPLPL